MFNKRGLYLIENNIYLTNLINSYFWLYIKALNKFVRKKVFIAIILMVFASFTEGIGLLLLIPLLGLVGLNVQSGSLGQIGNIFSSIANYFGFTPNLAFVLIIFVMVMGSNALLNRWQSNRSYDVQYDFVEILRLRLYDAVIHTNWLFFSRKKSSDFTHALTYEIERIGNGTNRFLTIISRIMVLAIYVLFAVKLSGMVSLLIFIIGLVLLLLIQNKSRLARKKGQELSISSKDLYSSTIQHLDGMKIVKSYNLQEDTIKDFSKYNQLVAKISKLNIRNFSEVQFLYDFGSIIVLSILVFIVTTYLKIPTAELLILLFIFFRIIPNFSFIQNNYQYFINMLPAFVTVKDLEKESILNAEPKTFEKKKLDLKKEIKFNSVYFAYIEENNNSVINNIDLVIKASETTAIVGQSGAGKSTIADLVMGFITPKSGFIMIDDKKLDLDVLLNWRNHIGYVSQETFLFNNSVRYNILIANPNATDNEIEEALKQAAAYEFVKELPEGLDTLVGDRGVKLSGGEKQRLALARALLRKPSLLILDEATSSLDSKNEKKIINAINNLHGEITILIIAHRLSTIKSSDYIYLIDKGHILESGTWEELANDNEGKFIEICKAQDINI